MQHRKTLLLALDFDPRSASMLSEALALADSLQATVHLIHVFTLRDKHEPARISLRTRTYYESSARSQLAAAGARCRARGRLGALLWQEGDPAGEILLAAKATSADIIVVGAGRQNIQARSRLGNVAEAVILAASCTVIVLRNNACSSDSN